jgi:glyoxylase-like metal-dependent hydrolase (beta-lactamase superfamily II)/rhodanese-related sulfurtransferase
MSEGEITIIDPARDPKPYYQHANLHDARIVAVIETHPHADFVSSHQEICHTKNADVYTSKLAGAAYKHHTFDDGDSFRVGNVTVHALNTPGHSPDSICVLVKDEQQKPVALFSGDTLFIGDVGRPDLREKAGAITATRESLARDMYKSTREKLMTLPDDVLIYPTHGAGSLCGKGISSASSSSIGIQKMENAALQPMSEDDFIQFLLADQPFVPLYFPFDVEMNKMGAPPYKESILRVPHLQPNCEFDKMAILVDTRPAAAFRQGHLPGAINLPDGLKFETWLGSIIAPDEKYYLLADEEQALATVIAKTAKIGYEKNIRGAVTSPPGATATSLELNITDFKQAPDQFTIIDIRNPAEVRDQKIFPQSLSIPLPELRYRLNDIPVDKPIIVHCAGGYRSAIGSSIIAKNIKNQAVYDLSENIKEFL